MQRCLKDKAIIDVVLLYIYYIHIYMTSEASIPIGVTVVGHPTLPFQATPTNLRERVCFLKVV